MAALGDLKSKRRLTEQDGVGVTIDPTKHECGHEAVTTFATLIDNFGEESIVTAVLFPYLGPGHYLFVAGINKRMKHLYEHYLRQNQDGENNQQHATNGSVIFQCPSQTKFYIKERNIDKSNVGLCSYVALHGNLELLKNLHKEGYKLDNNSNEHNLCSRAASGGHLGVLKWARANRCQWNSYTCQYAARYGHFETLKWARENGCEWDSATCTMAAHAGHLEILIWARENECPWDSFTCTFAALGGHLAVLKWARSKGCPWDWTTCSKAACGGHLDVLKWARENGCQWCSYTCWEAAKGGHLEVLKWARANGCGWDAGTCLGAAKGGHLDVLKWAVENGCKWNILMCSNAAMAGHLEVLKWARENGCNWDKNECLHLTRQSGHADTVDWISNKYYSK